MDTQKKIKGTKKRKEAPRAGTKQLIWPVFHSTKWRNNGVSPYVRLNKQSDERVMKHGAAERLVRAAVMKRVPICLSPARPSRPRVRVFAVRSAAVALAAAGEIFDQFACGDDSGGSGGGGISRSSSLAAQVETRGAGSSRANQRHLAGIRSDSTEYDAVIVIRFPTYICMFVFCNLT